MVAADFLETNFDKVFVQYQKLLHSDNYVTKRQSLKLLGELLLDRHNFSVSMAGDDPAPWLTRA
jgi:calcium binding protein 39